MHFVASNPFMPVNCQSMIISEKHGRMDNVERVSSADLTVCQKALTGWRQGLGGYLQRWNFGRPFAIASMFPLNAGINPDRLVTARCKACPLSRAEQWNTPFCTYPLRWNFNALLVRYLTMTQNTDHGQLF